MASPRYREPMRPHRDLTGMGWDIHEEVTADGSMVDATARRGWQHGPRDRGAYEIAGSGSRLARNARRSRWSNGARWQFREGRV